MPHIMVDIESLGTRPGVIVPQIGWCRFNASSILDSGVIYPSVHHQLLLGLKAEAETLEWWQEQDREVRHRVFDCKLAVDLDEALGQFAELVSAEALGEGGLLWADPDWFDLPVLQAVYNAGGVGYPWPRRQTADARTLRWLARMTNEERTESVRPHDGQYDAEAQAKDVIECLRGLRGT